VRIAAVAALQTLGKLHANNQGVATVKNVSRTGIGMETGQPPMRGQAVVLRVAIDDVMHELHTKVTRVKQRGSSSFYDVGLDWSNCTPEQLAFLDEILRVVEGQPLS